MKDIFDGFDLSNVERSDFKEDSVREILLVPFLKALGYTPYGHFSITRSPALTHPYVLIGTKKYRINIFPDYLLKVKNRAVCIIDAKSPGENIRDGKNVEQAYSYAQHPDVRVHVYALFNGRELTVFHVNRIEPILVVQVKDIESCWLDIVNVIAPMQIESYTPVPDNLYPDYGIYLLESGISQNVKQNDMSVPVDHIARVGNDTYSININRMVGDQEYAVSFDFDYRRLEQFLSMLEKSQAIEILKKLNTQPFQADVYPTHNVDIVSFLGNLTETKHEDIVPLVVDRFISLSCKLENEL